MPKQFNKSAPNINTRDFESQSPLIWSVNNVRLPKNVKWNFDDRRWQIPIFEDMSRQVVVMKPTQIGLTLISLCKYLHFADMHNIRGMYTLPRQDDVTDLVTSRLDEIVRNSEYLTSRLGVTDNVRMKKFGDSFIHFMESSVPPRMLDVDYLVNDEVDLSNQDYLQQYISRLDASPWRYHHRLSTPTIHNFGIHELYEKSDKKQWFIECPGCKSEFVLDWEKNVRNTQSGTWYACEKCGKKLSRETIQDGRWIVTGNRHADFSGYSVSQMMTTYITPDRLWAEKSNISQKNFHNLRLGLPFTNAIGALSKNLIYENCFLSGHEKEHRGEGYILGADQGNNIFVTIGKRGKNGEIEIVYIEEIPFEQGFDRLGYLIKAFGVKSAVIDALPNRHSAMDLAEKFPNIINLAYYAASDRIYKKIPGEPKVIIHKPDSFDYLEKRIASGELQFYGNRSRVDKIVRTAIYHLTNMRRDEEVQTTRVGGERTVLVWRNIGPDHFADSINYLSIAADLSGHRALVARQLSTGRGREDDGKPFNQNPYAHKKSASSLFRERRFKAK